MPAAQPAPPASCRPPPTRTRNGNAEDDREAAGRGQPQEDPRRHLAAVERAGAGVDRVAGRLARLGVEGERRRRPASGPTATTWAKYQVEPSDAAYHRAVPAPKKTRAAGVRTAGRIGSRPEEPEGEADVERADDDGEEASGRRRGPSSATNGQEDDGGQRRERDHAPAGRGPVRVDDRDDVVEVVVARAVRRLDDREADGELAVEPGLRLPGEVVVDGLVARAGSAGRGRSRPARGRGRRPARSGPGARPRRQKGAPGIGERALGYTPVHLSARSRRPYQHPCQAPQRASSARAGEQARVRLRDAIVPLGVLLALGLALRLIIAYVLLPGLRVRGRPGELQRLGDGARRERAVGPLRPPHLRRLHAGLPVRPVGPRARLPGALGGPASATSSSCRRSSPTWPWRWPSSPWPPSSARAGAAPWPPPPSSSSSRSPGSTAPSGPRWTRSGRSSSCSPSGSCGAGRSERAAVLTTIAAIIKPQFGILIPLAAVVIIRRHWVERPDDGKPPGRRPDPDRRRRRIAGLVDRGARAACPSAWRSSRSRASIGPRGQPAGPDPPDRRRLPVRHGQRLQPVGARRRWTATGSPRPGRGSATSPNPVSPADPFYTLLGIPAVLVGGGVILGGHRGPRRAALAAPRRPARAPRRPWPCMAIAFFVLPTRVHERYLYPFFALGAILLALRPRWAAVYAVLAAANFANLYGILTLPFYESPGLGPMLDAFGGLGTRLGEACRSTLGVWLAAIAHAGGLVVAAAFLVRPVAGETDRADERGVGDAAPWSARRRRRIGRRPRSRPDSRAPCRRIARPRWWPSRRSPARGDPWRAALDRDRPGCDRRPAGPGAGAVRPVRAPAPRGRRPPRPARPLVPAGPRRRGALPADLPARRAAADALRRGLPRADGDRVPAALAATASRTASTSTPTRTWPSTRSPRGSTSSATTRSWPRATSGRRSATWRSSRAGTSPSPPSRTRRPSRAAATGSTSPPATRSTCTTCGPASGWPASRSREPRRSRSTRTRTRRTSAPATGEVLVLDTAVPADDLRRGRGRRAGWPRTPAPFADPGGAAGEPVERLWTVGDRRLRHRGHARRRARDPRRGHRRRSWRGPSCRGAPRSSTRAGSAALVACRPRSRIPAAAAAEVARLLGGDEAAYRDAPGAGRAPGDRHHRPRDGPRGRSTRRSPTATLAGIAVQDVPRVAVADEAGRHLPRAGVGDARRAPSRSTPRRRGSSRSRASTRRPSTRRPAARWRSSRSRPRDAAAVARRDRLDAGRGGSGRRSTRPASSCTSWGATPDGTADDRLRRRAARATPSSPTPALPVRPGGLGARRGRRLPEHRPPAAARRSRADGAGAAVDVGQNAFAWRLPGVIAGRPHGGAPVPPGADPVPAARHRRAGGHLRPGSTGCSSSSRASR